MAHQPAAGPMRGLALREHLPGVCVAIVIAAAIDDPAGVRGRLRTWRGRHHRRVVRPAPPLVGALPDQDLPADLGAVCWLFFFCLPLPIKEVPYVAGKGYRVAKPAPPLARRVVRWLGPVDITNLLEMCLSLPKVLHLLRDRGCRRRLRRGPRHH